MASTAKYQPAAQQEPDDDYTHAPPAYGSTAEASSSSAHDPGLFAQPRSSDDNIPDDFKVCRKENASLLRCCHLSFYLSCLKSFLISAA
jgi:hypothetical protein